MSEPVFCDYCGYRIYEDTGHYRIAVGNRWMVITHSGFQGPDCGGASLVVYACTYHCLSHAIPRLLETIEIRGWYGAEV